MFKSPNHTLNQHPHRATCHERSLQGAPRPPDQTKKNPRYRSVSPSTRQAIGPATTKRKGHPSSSSSSSKPLFKEGKTHNSIYILINLWPSVLKLYNI